ncbi:MAG: sulfide/dihydroorotate dehydrogenase-like FAD/NAD-binding protein [Planctomycetes bacterium]|nr:sulfide/dihydroorotate dehydrogenase-like FAD/NAD-binding protein [Planctomycetota bacterium]
MDTRIRPPSNAVVGRTVLGPDVVRIDIESPFIASRRRAGQFVIVRVDERGERIPLTIADSDARRGTVSLIVQGVGKSTRQLNSLPVGSRLLDLVGPLGRPTHVIERGRVACVGGGIGTAVIFPIVKALHAAETHVIAIVGARNKGLLILEDDIRPLADEFFITTDDGSRGRKGFVSDQLLDCIKSAQAAGTPLDEVIAIGPVPMMRAVCNATRPFGIKTVVSLNSIMVDGTGMCGGCRASVGGEMKFVCVDGPEFDGHAVDFDELTLRLQTYREDEQRALKEYMESHPPDPHSH